MLEIDSKVVDLIWLAAKGKCLHCIQPLFQSIHRPFSQDWVMRVVHILRD